MDEELIAGDRVRLVGLKAPGMNGLVGTVTGLNEELGRWHVWLDGDQGEKLLKASNLELILGGDSDEEGGVDESDENFYPHDVRYCIVGSWDGWSKPRAMRWDQQDEVYKHRIVLGEDGLESFQIWLNGNLTHALHPKKASEIGCHYSESLVQGPDASGLGMNWAIGRNRSDKASPGKEYIIRLFLGKAGDFRVDWVRADAPPPKAKAKPKPKPTEAERPKTPAVEPEVAKPSPVAPPGRATPAQVPTPARVAQVAKPAAAPPPAPAPPAPAPPAPAPPAPTPQPTRPAVQEPPPAAATPSAPSAASSPPPWPTSVANQNMVLFLQDARPQWSDDSIAAVLEKLARVKIDNVVVLVLAVKEKGVWKNGGLNKKLAEVREEPFSEATLQAMRDTAEKLESRTKPGKAKPQIKLGVAAAARASASEAAASVLAAKSSAAPTTALTAAAKPGRAAQADFDIQAAIAAVKAAKGVGKGKPTDATGSKGKGTSQAASSAAKAGEDERLSLELQAAIAAIESRSHTQEFKVVDARADVHTHPDASSSVLDAKARGTIITAEEETFDGWARLHGESGWVHKEHLVLHGEGNPYFAVSEASRTVGWPQKFEVVFAEVPVCKAPSRSLEAVLGVRHRGEHIFAEAQSYNGWVHLLDGGWMPSADPQHGMLLRCSGLLEEKAQREEILEARDILQRQVPEMLNKDDDTEVRRGLAMRTGWTTTLGELEAKQAVRRKLRTEILQARGNAVALGQCAATATEAGRSDEAAVAQAWQQQAVQAKRQAESGNAALLEELAAAASSGDLQAFSAAREAAKRAGIGKKEIARVLALANSA